MENGGRRGRAYRLLAALKPECLFELVLYGPRPTCMPRAQQRAHQYIPASRHVIANI